MSDSKRMNDTLNGIIDNLESSERIAVMDEYAFKEYFLPYLNGSKVDENDNIRIKWIEYADGANKPVKVVDDTGKELFKVPPLLGSIDVIKSKETSYGRINDTATREIERLPIKGLHDHGVALSEAVDSIELEEYPDTWQNIFDRYKDNVIKDTVSDTDKDEEDEDIIYE